MQTIVIVSLRVTLGSQAIANFLLLFAFFIFFCVQVNVRPFKSDPGNETQFWCCFCLILSLMCVMTLQSLNASGVLPTDWRSRLVWHSCWVSLAVGAYFIAKNAGRELIIQARDEIRKNLATALLSVPIFAECSDDFVSAVSTQSCTKQYEVGHVFSKAGDVGDRMWVIREGIVELTSHDGSEVIQYEAKDGLTPCFGDLALVEDAPRKFTFRAQTKVIVNVILLSDLQKCFKDYPMDEEMMINAVLTKYKAVAGHDFSSTAVDDLINMVAIDTKNLHGAACAIQVDKRDAAIQELNRRASIQETSHERMQTMHSVPSHDARGAVDVS